MDGGWGSFFFARGGQIAIACAETPSEYHSYQTNAKLINKQEDKTYSFLCIIVSGGFPTNIPNQKIHTKQQR